MSRPKRPMDSRYMRWYVEDFLSSKFVQSSPLHVVGAYVLLLNHSRSNGLDPSEDDIQTLSRLESKDWAKWGPKILKKFTLCEDGKYRHPKIMDQDANTEEYREERRKDALRGWEIRKGTHQKPIGSKEGTHTEPMQNPDGFSMLPSPSPSPSPLTPVAIANELALPGAPIRLGNDGPGRSQANSGADQETEPERLSRMKAEFAQRYGKDQ